MAITINDSLAKCNIYPAEYSDRDDRSRIYEGYFFQEHSTHINGWRCHDNAITYFRDTACNLNIPTYLIFARIYGSQQRLLESDFKERLLSTFNGRLKSDLGVEEDLVDIDVIDFSRHGTISDSNSFFVVKFHPILIQSHTSLYFILKLIRYIMKDTNGRTDYIALFKEHSGNLRLITTYLENIKEAIDFWKAYSLYYFEIDGYPTAAGSNDLRKKFDAMIIEKQKQIQKEATMNALAAYKTKNPINVAVFSRHPTHAAMRKVKVNYRLMFRFGSETPTPVDKRGRYIEINSPDAVHISSHRLLMKQHFQNANVTQAAWCELTDRQRLEAWIAENDFQNEKFVVKSNLGSRNRGNTLCNNLEELYQCCQDKYNQRYVVEKFYNFNKEYRLHVHKTGCFYTCRKMLKSDTPQENRWFRNDSNSVWIIQENEMFDRPNNWNAIVQQCVNALNAVGLDVGACDVRIQSNTDKKGNRRDNPEFIICEINSAPSFGDRTLEEYQDVIPTLINNKFQ